MKITVPNRAVRGHSITLTVTEITADSSLKGKSLSIKSDAFEGTLSLPPSLKEGQEFNVRIRTNAQATKYPVSLWADSSEHTKTAANLQVDEPAIGFAAAPTVSDSKVSILLKLEHGIPLVAMVYIKGDCLIEGATKDATWDSSKSAYKLTVDGDARSKTVELPIQDKGPKSDHKLHLEAIQNCVVYDASAHGDIEGFDYFQGEVEIESEDMPAPTLEFADDAIIGEKVGDDYKIGQVEFKFALSSPAQDDNGAIEFEIHGEHLVESPLTVNIPVGKSEPENPVLGTLVETGMTGDKAKSSKLLLKAKNEGCTIGTKDHVEYSTIAPIVSLTSDSKPKVQINEEKLILDDLVTKITLSYRPKGLTSQVKVKCANLAAPITIAFDSDDNSTEITHTFKNHKSGEADSATLSHWKEEPNWRDTQELEIDKDNCEFCIAHKENKGIEILSPLRLFLHADAGSEKKGLYGVGTLDNGNQGPYRGPFIHGDTIKFQVCLNRISTFNEFFELRLRLGETKEPIIVKDKLSIDAGKLNTDVLEVKLDHDDIKKLTENSTLRASLVSTAGDCSLEETYHDLLLSENERDLQIVPVHPLPIIIFHPERAIHFGPAKEIEEERNKKYDADDADSYHYTLVAKDQKLVLCLNEATRQQKAHFEIHNKKRDAMDVDAHQLEFPTGTTEYVTPSISFHAANKVKSNKTKQIEIVPLEACRIITEDSKQEKGKKGKNQAHLLRIQMLRASHGSFYFSKNWITPTGSADKDYSESGESIPLVAPHDQIWVTVTRDAEDLAESNSDYYLYCEAFGEEPIPVSFEADKKESKYVCKADGSPEKGLRVAEVEEDRYKLRFYRKRTGILSGKMSKSDKKFTINGENVTLTKIIDTQFISVRNRYVCFHPDVKDTLEQVKPSQENVNLTIRLSVPAGPMTWVKLIPERNTTTTDHYYIPFGVGESLVEQSVNFQAFEDHSSIKFTLEAHNGVVQTISSAKIDDEEKEKLKTVYPDTIGTHPTLIAFNAEMPIEETLYKSKSNYTDLEDEYDGAKVVGQALNDMEISLRLKLSHPLGKNVHRKFTISSEAFSAPIDLDGIAYDEADNKDGNHPWDPTVLGDLEKCKQTPVMVEYKTVRERTQYIVHVVSGVDKDDNEITDMEISVRVSHPGSPAALLRNVDEINEGDPVVEIDGWLPKDKNENKNLFAIKLSENINDITAGENNAIAVQISKVASVSIGRDLDKNPDDAPWIEPIQQTFANGDPARIWLTTNEAPEGSNATCYLVSPIVKQVDESCRIPVEFSTVDTEKSVDITFDIDGIDAKNLKKWFTQAGRWIRNVWQDHKGSTLFLEQEIAAIGDDSHKFKGAKNPLLNTQINLLHKRYVTFRKNNHFAEAGPYRICENKAKLPLDAPPLYVHLSIPAPLGGCTFKIKSEKKAKFFTDEDYQKLVTAATEAEKEKASLLSYSKENTKDEDIKDSDFATITAEDDKSATIHITEGIALGIVRVALLEDSLDGKNKISLEAVDDGYCHLHSKSSRNIKIEANFGDPKVKKITIDEKRTPHLGGFAVIRVELENPAPRDAHCFVKAHAKYWDQTDVQFTCGETIGKALVYIKDQPTEDESKNGLDIELETPTYVSFDGGKNKAAKLLKVEQPAMFGIESIMILKGTPEKNDKGEEIPPEWTKLEAKDGFKKKGDIKLKKIKVGDKLRFELKRKKVGNQAIDKTVPLDYVIRSLNCGATVANGTIPTNADKANRDILITVADPKKAHELVFHKEGNPELALLHPDQTVAVTVEPKEKPKGNTQECEAVRKLREKEARESGHTLLEPEVVPLKQPCYLHSFDVTINYGDISIKSRPDGNDRTFTITQDPHRANEKNVLICTDETAPIIQVVSGPPEDDLFTADVVTTKKWKFFGDKTKSITPDDIHYKAITINPNPGKSEKDYVNHFCEDSFDYSDSSIQHNHPIVVIADRQMGETDWDKERELIQKVNDLSVLKNTLEWRKALGSEGPIWNRTEKSLRKVESKLIALRSDLDSRDDELNENHSARILNKTGLPALANKPFPDLKPGEEPADSNYSVSRRKFPEEGKRSSWEYLRPVPAPNGVRSAMGGVEACRTISFPIYQSFMPWTTQGGAKGFLKRIFKRNLETTPPQQYYIGLNACGKPDLSVNPPKPEGTVSKLQAVVEVYPSDELYFMIGVGAPPDNKIKHIGAEGTYFDPAQDFDPSVGFDPEFKKGIKSVSKRERPSELPDLKLDGTDIIIKPYEDVDPKYPNLTLSEYQKLGDAAFIDRGDKPPIRAVSDAVSPGLFDKAVFYHITEEKGKKNQNVDSIDSDFVYYNYDDTSMTFGRRDIEFSKTSQEENDEAGLKGFTEAWDSVKFSGNGQWEDSNGGDGSDNWYADGLWAIDYLPRVFIGRNGRAEKWTGPSATFVNQITTVFSYTMRIANFLGVDDNATKAPTMGFGFNIKIKGFQGEYVRYSGWKEASDHRVFFWKYQNVNMTLFDITLEFICGFEFKVLGYGVSLLMFASIQSACNARTAWETEPPTLPVKKRRDWNKGKESHIDCDLAIAGGLRAELIKEYFASFKGQITAKIRFRFDVSNEFRLNIFNGGATAMLEFKVLTKTKEHEWVLWQPDTADTPTASLGAPFTDPNSMGEIESLLSRIDSEIKKGRFAARGYLQSFQELQLNMYVAGGRNALTLKLPILKTAQDGDEWDHNKRLWDQQWSEVKSAFSAEKHKVKGRGSAKWNPVGKRLKARSDTLEEFISDKIAPMINSLRQVEIQANDIKDDFERALEEFDKPDQSNRKVMRKKAKRLLATARKAVRGFETSKFDSALRDLSHYARNRKHW